MFGESATMNTRAAGKKARGYVSEGFHAIAALSWNTFLSGRASMRLALREPFRDGWHPSQCVPFRTATLRPGD